MEEVNGTMAQRHGVVSWNQTMRVVPLHALGDLLRCICSPQLPSIFSCVVNV